MKKLLSLLTVFVVLAMVDAPALADKESNSVTYNMTQEPPQMYSIKSTDTTSFQLFRHLLIGLLTLDQNDQPIPGVAKEYTVSTDGLTYTFKLRDDALWQDGVKVTAKDFEYAWTQLLNPAMACQYAEMAFCIKNAKPFYDGTAKREELGIKVIDDLTLEVTLEYPVAYFPSLMAFGVFMPLRQDVCEKFGDAYATDADKFIGNGPYNVESWQHESEFVMVKSETFFDKDSIKIGKLIGKMINDTSTAFNMYDTGDLEMILLSGTTLPLAEAAGYTVKQYADGATFYLEFNCKDPVTSNINIRKALGMAINRQSFVDNILRDHSVPALSYTTPEIMGFGGEKPFSEFVTVNYKDADVEQAKTYWEKGLTELGMTAEEAASKITLIADDTDVAKEVSAAYQEYWRTAFGVEIVVENMPFKSRLQRTKDHQFSIVSAGWGPDYNDPMTFLAIMTTGNGNNTGEWSSKEYDDLIAKANVEADLKARMELMYKAESILLDEMGIAPVYFRNRNYLVADGLDGVYRSAFQDYCFNWASWAE